MFFLKKKKKTLNVNSFSCFQYCGQVQVKKYNYES